MNTEVSTFRGSVEVGKKGETRLCLGSLEAGEL